MAGGIFDPEFDQLPMRIPIFPLPSALLLPGGQLPLNIFESRYLAMVKHAMATPTRLIGMVQPRDHADDASAEEPTLFETGCAGRVSFFQESDDGRFVIALNGVCRFHWLDQQLDPNGFLVADVDWRPFANDLRIDVSALDRDPLMDVLRRYFDLKGFETDWTQIENSDNHQLLATLSMVCPFEVAEKQALLEADSMASRADLLIAMMEMAIHDETGGNDARH
ncbi:MAG: LON peptidase substrate-binding domain-containing protein [Candidatus Puniceispirillum sp.]|nr:LON peptidase substrate-binding domain-containing protein [Candidatus Puniceispirillum sp.]MBL6774008.1 LON peptidase substrate-binding domain-containing protein [Candidatus Puniceispirillum sp.]